MTAGDGQGELEGFGLLQLAGLTERVEAIEAYLGTDDEPGPGRGYRPRPAPRWWLLQGDERAEAIALLAAWVEQVYRPVYGYQAALLPPCWDRHPLVLVTLDWLSEIWQLVYLQPKRSGNMLASQAEWQTRLLPAAAEQMAKDAQGCDHKRARP